MRLVEFFRVYPDEAACVAKLRQLHDQEQHVCPRCGHTQWYWKNDKLAYECKHCHRRESIRKGTVMEYSKLPILIWFKAMHFLTATQASFSALEMKHQLGLKHPQPVWAMLHKIRSIMGKLDDSQLLSGTVGVETTSFTTMKPGKRNVEKSKPGSNTIQTKVLVLVGKRTIEPQKPGQKPINVSQLKMIVVKDIKPATIHDVLQRALDPNASTVAKGRTLQAISMHNSDTDADNPPDTTKDTKRGHFGFIMKFNADTHLANLHHVIKADTLQLYLNEYCFKYNRRHSSEDIFDQLLFAAAHYTSDFFPRSYGSQNRRIKYLKNKKLPKTPTE